MARRLAVTLTASESDALLKAARDATNAARSPSKQFAAWRDFVMVNVGLYAGCRVSELCGLNVEDANLETSTLAVIEGKGQKDRNIPIGKKLEPVLREWIGDRTSGPLFPVKPNGKRIAPRTFQERLDALAAKAGLRKNVHPHLMRHSFACALLRSGTDVRELQELLGHANLATTAKYLHVEVSRLKSAVDRL